MEVDAHTRLCLVYFRNEEFLPAEKEYDMAVGLVEDYQKRKLIGTGRVFGYPYHYRGDLAYYESQDLDKAFLDYSKALENGDSSSEMDYKIGYIHYFRKNYPAALESFLACVEGHAPANIPANLLFATGNAFYQREDLFAAQGYYMRLVDLLTDKKAGVGNLQPNELPDHKSLVELLWKANNNLGVATFRVSQKMGDRRKRSEALVYLTAASEQYDVLKRNQETMERPEGESLPFLNMRGILYPRADFDPLISDDIPKDLKALFF
jgi:tetratricopeptide (TPR) repeat protein